MQPIITFFQSLFKFMKRRLLVIKISERVLSLLQACFIFPVLFIFNKIPATYAFQLCVKKNKVNPFEQDMIRHISTTDIM